jgi:hypothetical protein
MSQWTNGDYEPNEGDSGGRRRVLYWWPAPVSSDQSAQVGRRMLVGTLAWLAVFLVMLVAVGVFVAVTG